MTIYSNMTFDVIITTYNRPERVLQFTKQILTCNNLPENIIIVDSSDEENKAIQQLDKVKYIRSNHKNQPYQRYLGAAVSAAEIICFFDDDLEIIDKDVFTVIRSAYQSNDIVGTGVGIDYHNSIFSGGNVKEIPRMLAALTGVPMPAAGKMSYAGVAGSKPIIRQEVDVLNGPCMSFKRLVFLTTKNNRLLDIFEARLGMGEDKFISLQASTSGKIIFEPQNYLYHPAVESSYFSNVKTFYTKVIFSRQILNDLYCQVKGINSYWGKLRLWWYTLGRLLNATIRIIIKPSAKQWQVIAGTLNGIQLMINNSEIPAINWDEELRSNLISNGYN